MAKRFNLAELMGESVSKLNTTADEAVPVRVVL